MNNDPIVQLSMTLGVDFNRDYWIEQLKKEVGLETVSYEDLHNHYVNFDSPFGKGSDSPTSKINARKYVDDQLLFLENEYKNFIDNQTKSLIESDNVHRNGRLRNSYDELDIFSRLDLTAKSLDKFENAANVGADYNNLIDNPYLLKPIEQTINRDSIKYYEVFMNNQTFIVAFNLNGADVRVHDQINHLKNTSYFVEERNPFTFIGGEEIISYYQFSNLIETLLRMSNKNVSDKITNNIQTTFDGLKLDNFS